MGAGMLDDPPPIEIEAVLLYVELFLHLDTRHAEEGREVGGHGVGEIDHGLEAASGRLRHGRRAGGKTGGDRPGPLEETAPGERMADRFLASGNAHLLLLLDRNDGSIHMG